MENFKRPQEKQKISKDGRANVTVRVLVAEWQEFREFFKDRGEFVYRHLEEALKEYLNKAKKQLKP